MNKLLKEVRECTICDAHLPLGPRPVLQIDTQARILIAGQAPGRKVHETGVPFDDPSGKRLRDWMGIDSDIFYDEKKIAILPMGFCYPGSGKSGDLPPRRECAETWRDKILAKLKNIKLTLVIGQYAIGYHLPDTNCTLTEVVQSWRSYWPHVIPLPHPSPRNNIWLKRNSWFEKEVLPELRKKVLKILN
jgi:uracil-DNA glycosylase